MSEAMPPTADLLAKAHFRPVLPRPAPELAAPQPRTGPIHGIGQPSRYPVHENLFSPYGRAYEYARSSSTVSDMDAAPSHVHRDVSPGDMPVSPSPVSAMDYDGAMSWPPSVTSYTPAACGCGPSCACPGCLEHSAQPNPAAFSYDTCVNPEQCSACLSCAVNSMPVSMPQETASLQGQSMEFLPPGLPSNQTQQQIFDWLESVPPQMYAPPPGPPPSDPAYPMYAQQAWSAPQLPSYSQPLGQNGAGRCCDGGCMCAPGQCTCEGHERLTFATSGMRAACCGPPTSVSATDLVTPRGRSDSVSSGAGSSSSFPTRGPPLSNDAPFMLAQAEGSVPSFYDYDYALSTSSGSSSLSRSPSITSLQSLGSVDSGGQAPRVGYPMGDRQSTLMPTTDGDGYQLRRERTLMPEGFPLGDRQRTLMPDEEARKDRSFVQRARAFVKSCRPGSTRAVPAPVVIHSGHGQRPGQGHDRDGSPSSMHMGAVQMDTPYDTMQLP